MSPTVDVAIVAWPVSPARLVYCQMVIEALRSNLLASRHTMRVAVSIGQERDPLRRWCGQELTAYLDHIGIAYQLRLRRTQERLGFAMNEAVAMCDADYVLLVQDDHHLACKLDLSDSIDLMEDTRGIDLVRFGWSTIRKLTPTTHPYRPGWLRVDLSGRWPYADNAHLRRRSFQDKFGKYDECSTHGDSEHAMVKRVRIEKALIVLPDRPTLFHSLGHEPADFRTPRHKQILERLSGGQKR